MRIECPFCGARDSAEFAYLGDATGRRPDMASATPDAMADYVYLRDNPAGPHTEFWYHGAGCHAWLIVSRDTRTHAMAAVAVAEDVILAERQAAR